MNTTTATAVRTTFALVMVAADGAETVLVTDYNDRAALGRMARDLSEVQPYDGTGARFSTREVTV